MIRHLSPSLAVILLSGCVTADFTGFGTARADFEDQGARRVAAAERADILVGNTLVAEGVTVHYATDGTKTIRRDDGYTLERAWRVREDGIMCEELTVAGFELCADAFVLYEKDGVFRSFRPDGSAHPMTYIVIEGPPPADVTSADILAGSDRPTADPEG